MNRTRKSRRCHCLVAAGLAALLPVSLWGCGADPSDTGAPAGAVSVEPENKIAAAVHEWSVRATSPRAREGEVTFVVSNFGTIAHEFLVVRTDFGDGGIPLGQGSRFDEEADGLRVVDEISEFGPGRTESLTIGLPAGRYQLLCNIEGHYANGMHMPFEVLG